MSEETEFLFTDDGIASSCFNWRVIVAVPCAAVASYAAMTAVKYLSALRKQPLPSEPLSAFANEALQILTTRAACKYNSENLTHERQLLQVWKQLKPHEVLDARISRKWGEIGFQGTDPASDFRGMGMLGLDCISYFTSEHRDQASSLIRPLTQEVSYPFAIACINIAHHLLTLLRTSTSLSNALFVDGSADPVARFGELFSEVMVRFDAFYIAFIQQYLADGGKSQLAVMQFNAASTNFFQEIKAIAALPHDSARFRQYFGAAISKVF